jgi:flagellar motility protein MotE (MotC chaperone)
MPPRVHGSAQTTTFRRFKSRRALVHHVTVRPDQHERYADERRNEPTRRTTTANQRAAAAYSGNKQPKRSDREHEQIERASALRRQLADLAGQLASTERDVADLQERLASLHPDEAAKYEHLAELAREGERRASQIAKHFAS